MGIKERLRSDLTEAIRSRDEISSSTIRMVLTAITTEEVAGKTARELTEPELITVLSREVKKLREAAEAFDLGARPERANLERSEMEVLTHYLPTQLSEAELAEIIHAAIKQSGAAGPAGMGMVMKVIAPAIAGKADGGAVSAAVKQALQNNL